MNPADDTATDNLVASLDEADTALRAAYRDLAENPDLAGAYEPRLKELHARRLELAQKVGLAFLAQVRALAGAPRVAAEPPLLSMPAVTATVSPTPEPESSNTPEDVPSSFEPEPEVTASVPATAAPEPEEPVGPPSEPASDAELARWKSAVRSGGLGVGLNGSASGQSSPWALTLHGLMKIVGDPRDLAGSVGPVEEMEALDAIGSEDRQELWARLPKSAQQVWLAMLVARTRTLRELPDMRDRVKAVILRYPAWAKKYEPGHVNGLQIKHAPIHGTWAQDARRSWEGLLDLLGEERREVRSPPTPKKKAKRETHEDDAEVSAIDSTWRLLPLVQGRRAILLGGEPREPNRERLEHALRLDSLEWSSVDGPRKVEAAAGRIRKGTYGLVLVLKPFVAHKESEPIIEAAKVAKTPWALVDGYGITAVKLGLERFLGGPRSGASKRGLEAGPRWPRTETHDPYPANGHRRDSGRSRASSVPSSSCPRRAR